MILFQGYTVADGKAHSSDSIAGHSEVERWYTPLHLQSGERLYKKHCIVCHNTDARGTLDWKKTRANGDYPPPPLNGSAHAWHHDLSTLTQTIQDGGVPLGGVMPAFRSQLTNNEILAVIAYFQNFWSDDIYASWLELGGRE